MKLMCVALVALIQLAFSVQALATDTIQKKPLAAVDIDKFTAELQVVVSDNASMTQVWWIPAEFWGAAFMRTNPALADQALSKLTDYGILAVVQADITPMAGFVFYDQADVKKRMTVRFKSYEKEPLELKHASELSDSVEMLLGVLSPMFSNTMGELGKNMHLYVIDNQKDKKRIVDPYMQGNVEVVLAATKSSSEKRLTIDLPVDALFEPRYCPNGKPAHISWQYCPWSGKKL